MNFHEEKAKEMFGKEHPTVEEIRMAKAINFGQLYGIGINEMNKEEISRYLNIDKGIEEW